MSRTTRNRHVTPPGWVVRDDGVLYKPSCCPNGTIHSFIRKESLRSLTRWDCDCHQEGRFVRSWTRMYSREKKKNRKMHWRLYRAQVKDRIRHEDWEGIPRYRKTSGWLTW